MSVLTLGAENVTFAVKETVAEIADLLDNLCEDERHVQLTDLGGNMILVHRDILDLATS